MLHEKNTTLALLQHCSMTWLLQQLSGRCSKELQRQVIHNMPGRRVFGQNEDAANDCRDRVIIAPVLRLGESADWWRRTNGSVSDVSGEDPPSSPGGADTDTRHVFRPPPPPSPWCDQISRMNQIYAGNRVGAVQFKNYAMQCLV